MIKPRHQVSQLLLGFGFFLSRRKQSESQELRLQSDDGPAPFHLIRCKRLLNPDGPPCPNWCGVNKRPFIYRWRLDWINMKAGLSNPPKGEKLKRGPNLIWQPAARSLRLLGDRRSAETEAGGFESRVEKLRPPSSRITEKEAAAQIRFTRRGVTARQGQSRLKSPLSASNEPKLGSEAEPQHRFPAVSSKRK